MHAFIAKATGYYEDILYISLSVCATQTACSVSSDYNTLVMAVVLKLLNSKVSPAPGGRRRSAATLDARRALLADLLSYGTRRGPRASARAAPAGCLGWRLAADSPLNSDSVQMEPNGPVCQRGRS